MAIILHIWQNPQKALMHLPRRHQWGSATRQAKVKPTTFEMKHIHVLTFSLVHFNRKCNLLPVCPSHNNFQCFQADMLKVRRSGAVCDSTVNSWRVETISNEIFQILLIVLIAKGYIFLVNLQKSALWCLLTYRKTNIISTAAQSWVYWSLEQMHVCACICTYCVCSNQCGCPSLSTSTWQLPTNPTFCEPWQPR